MVHHFTLCQSSDGSMSDGCLSRGPPEIRVTVNTSLKPPYQLRGDAQCLSSASIFVLRDMLEYLKHTAFVIDSHNSADFLRPWCDLRGAYDLIRKLRIKVVAAYFDRRLNSQLPRYVDLLPRLSSLQELVFDVDEWTTEMWLKRLAGSEDLIKALRIHTSWEDVTIVLSRLITLRLLRFEGWNPGTMQKCMDGVEIRKHKIALHALHNIAAEHFPNVQLQSELHLEPDETDEEILKPSAYFCCAQHL